MVTQHTFRPTFFARALAALVGGTLAVSTLSVTAAHGGAALPSDDQLIVATAGHVDSPKVFYSNGSLVLNAGVGPHIYPLESTINYFGKGVNKFGKQEFMFEIPEDAPELDFLGEPGDAWYMGHVNPVPNPISTIWAGFGADTDIPVDQFRDALFTLDLVKANGPGRVEMTRWTSNFGSLGHAVRMFSSADPHYNSHAMTPGNHTHNYTFFEKPGRYELVYRASARTKDGQLIHSAEKTLQWQVGGNRPGRVLNSEIIPADVGSGFTIGDPASSPHPDVRSHMRSLTVKGMPVQNGTVEFLIDGFHLASVALEGGAASWTEMLGSSPARYQAIVRDSSGSPVWVSEVLDFNPKGDTVHTALTGEIMASHPSPSISFPATELLVNGDVNITATVMPSATHDDARTVTVDLGRAGIYGLLSFGVFANADSETVESEVYWHSSGQQRFTFEWPDDSYDEDMNLRLLFRPHPVVKNLESVSMVIADSYAPGTRYEVQGVARATTEAAPEEPELSDPGTSDSNSGTQEGNGSDTSEGDDNSGGTETGDTQDGQPVGPEGPGTSVVQDNPDAPKWGTRLRIRDGHLDIAAATVDGRLHMQFIDDSRAAGPARVIRKLDDVALIVPDTAKLLHLPKNADDWAAVLDLDGDNWYLPQTQKKGLPWPGYSTERATLGQAPQGYRLHIDSYKGPGDFALFNENFLERKPEVLLGSRAGAPRSLVVGENTHAHASWTFNKPGIYEIGLSYEVIPAEGTALRSVPERTATQTLLFVVGDEVIAAGPNAGTLPQGDSDADSSQSGKDEGGDAQRNGDDALTTVEKAGAPTKQGNVTSPSEDTDSKGNGPQAGDSSGVEADGKSSGAAGKSAVLASTGLAGGAVLGFVGTCLIAGLMVLGFQRWGRRHANEMR